ncbi:MAG: thioredoxin [Gammaproteobacteria bacterium]
MSDSAYIVEVNADNFEAVILQGSMQQPVLVDFWADWCQPCQALMPILSKLAEEYTGKFILAKVNSDENQTLASQFDVRSLPTVKLFKQGQPVDEFMGTLPEGEVRAFLDKHIEQPSDKLQETAIAAFHDGNPEEALRLLEEANQMDPGRAAIVTDLANLLAQTGNTERARELLDNLPADERDSPEVKSLQAKLAFSAEVTDLPDVEQLRSASTQGDLKAMSQLTTWSIANEDYRSALELALTIMQKDRSFKDDLGRKTLLQIFDMLGTDPLVNEYRRKMASALY